MSRLNPQPQKRGLTLTEELERLEQQITLTLQEIDSNFSRAHRIVTTSILPIVDQHAEQSRRVWEGAKFWKQFFEFSANVSLSGYEDAPTADAHDQNQDSLNQRSYDEQSTLNVPQRPTGDEGEISSLNVSQISEQLQNDESNLSSLSISPSRSTTPRPRAFQRLEDEEPGTLMDCTSPYEQMRRELNETPSKAAADAGPVTPERPRATDISATPMSSPWVSQPRSAVPVPDKQHHHLPAKGRDDPVFHRVLDKTYRIQSTPLNASLIAPAHVSHFGASRGYGTGLPSAAKTKQLAASIPSSSRPAFMDSSPPSSPELEAPKLNAELFDSPLKDASNMRSLRGSPAKRSPMKFNRSPVKPGVSVLTPMKPSTRQAMWDSDEEGDEEADDATRLFGGSPPKTMQFHVPQSRLLQTPAKEASRRIVADILTTAGRNDFTDDSITTPDVVRRMDYSDDESL
ncbi:DASH complex subunit ask1 [Ascosphaera aggregata]|nr:DASH complex subunit ask1 [Ascosphaera aggregata]